METRVPSAGVGVLRDAAVFGCGRLGNPRGSQQRSLERGLSPRVRAAAQRLPVQHLHGDWSGLRAGDLHLPLRLHPGGERVGAYTARTRGGLRHPGRAALADSAQGDAASGAAGAAGGHAGGVSPSHEQFRRARDHRVARGTADHHDQDLDAVPVSATAGARGRRGGAAARRHHRAVAAAAASAGPTRVRGDRRQGRPARPRAARTMEGAGFRLRRGGGDRCGRPALPGAGAERLLAHAHHHALAREFHAAQSPLRVHGALGHQISRWRIRCCSGSPPRRRARCLRW